MDLSIYCDEIWNIFSHITIFVFKKLNKNSVLSLFLEKSLKYRIFYRKLLVIVLCFKYLIIIFVSVFHGIRFKVNKDWGVAMTAHFFYIGFCILYILFNTFEANLVYHIIYKDKIHTNFKLLIYPIHKQTIVWIKHLIC